MSERDSYEEAKKVLGQINHILATESLTAEQRRELEIRAASLAGVIMHPWLPMSWPRRLVMAAIVLLGLQQAAWVGNYEPFLWWLLLPFFSPRIVGGCAYAWGLLTASFRRGNSRG